MKPTIPSGTRDFSPSEMAKRNFIFSSVRKVFEKFGFQQIETPAMEKLETLEGKYGEEGDKLLFRILNSGPVLEKIKVNVSSIRNSDITEKGLRYDLTVPFARYVVQHHNEITFPFKRYQVQPVWRADRPQKGRYREFYQCDADVIGSNSLLNEVEIIQMIDEVFALLNIPVTIKINNRKILSGLIEEYGIENDKAMNLITALDKLDKIGIKGVMNELREIGITEDKINSLLSFIEEKPALNSSTHFDSSVEDTFFIKSEKGKEGIRELRYVLKHFLNAGDDNKMKLSLRKATLSPDFFLARGLNYYTGTIFEVKTTAEGIQMGSICGGGRYDDLTGVFGLAGVSGVGISFGIDRIFDVMNELNLFDNEGLQSFATRVMLAHFNDSGREYCLPLASRFRNENINTEIYPDIVKIKKQFDYANKKQIPYVIIIGDDEIQSGILSIKNMLTGEQSKKSLEEIICDLKNI